MVEAEPFTIKELLVATDKLRTGKAAGLDGVLPETIESCSSGTSGDVRDAEWSSITSEISTTMVKGMCGSHTEIQICSHGERVISQAYMSSQHSRKLFEFLMRESLVTEWDAKSSISATQFGFQKGCSTTQAVQWLTETAKQSRKTCCVFVTR
ncbi:hypothetical protein JTB14_019905 [Gonioctena quinquepunctata]|nr:hypothetical protein JTB14_019905 [Gonioctena quinquepunctata]